MEVLAKEEPLDLSTSGKKVRKSPSLGNLLKTPSRMALRRVSSKLHVFSDTPQSALKKHYPSTIRTHFHETPSCPPPVPSIPDSATTAVPDVKTPRSSKSIKSTKSGFFRTALKDKTKSANIGSGNGTHAIPGTVAAHIQKLEDLSTTTVKTPKSSGWFGKLAIGRSSSKKKARQELPSFLPPSDEHEKLQPEFESSSDVTGTLSLETASYHEHDAAVEMRKLAVGSDMKRSLAEIFTVPATPLVVTPLIEEPPYKAPNRQEQTSRLSAYSVNLGHSPVREYFPNQALVASSPMSGDLHIVSSPARQAQAAMMLKSSMTVDHDLTQTSTVFDKTKKSERPTSEPC